MTELSVDNLLTKAKNKFLLVNAASARAKQVSDGSLPYIDNFDPTNPVITALREIAADKFRIKVASADSKKPQEILLADDDENAPSQLDRLAKGAKEKPKEKPKKKK
ncbi:MAG: DNA-directed RNA polymerase subunit omega [Candidatus Margulisbacteria bacterium]|nr:DNA-directed RNA polymerase subunit omega [Candidatus Margulisiibacteriota bacterium]MBU1617739.1 DNA-directed RNA polymerase subunit omega [Candidatus Margulisiibacteriota bacterium]MBU1866868.1 DNA-directed RNA polymerase subunit omega [Candidatus Margulisiibacteriota bacterium]